MRYRRANTAGGTYFFTVNLAERHSDLLVRHIEDLRTALQKVKQAHPFATLAMVVLPEHLHALWRLPPGDADYPVALVTNQGRILAAIGKRRAHPRKSQDQAGTRYLATTLLGTPNPRRYRSGAACGLHSL